MKKFFCKISQKTFLFFLKICCTFNQNSYNRIEYIFKKNLKIQKGKSYGRKK